MISLQHAVWSINRQQLIAGAAALIALCIAVPSWPEETSPEKKLPAEESIGDSLLDRLNGNVSLRTGYWSSSRSLDNKRDILTSSLWLKMSQEIDDTAIALDGWVLGNDLLKEKNNKAELRELFINGTFGQFDLRAGKQIIMWGRADRINPTDNLTPRDFTLLFPDEDDQRTGATAVKSTYYPDSQGLSLTGIWIADFEPHRLPLGTPPPPFRMSEQEPHRKTHQGAVKLDQSGGAVDWSLSYFDGYDLTPDIDLQGTNVILIYHRIRVIGADIASSYGRYGMRAEMAYTATCDSSGSDPNIKNPFLLTVLGVDRTFYENLYVNLQYLFRAVRKFEDPEALQDPVQRKVSSLLAVVTNQIDRYQQGASLRISSKWLHDTLEGEVVGILYAPHASYAVKPKIVYAVTDHLKLIAGGDYFHGPDKSFFGHLSDNSLYFAEVRWNF